MRNQIQTSLLAVLLLLSGCATQPGNREISEARASLNLAERNRSHPAIAAGYYLDAGHLAAQTLAVSSGKSTADAIKVYNRAAEELTVLLSSTPELWNRTETFNSPHGTYRLHFAPGLKSSRTWDPGYFTFFRTSQEMKEQSLAQRDHDKGLGGDLVGVSKPKDPRSQFLPLVGVAAPVTVTLDFAGSKKSAGDVTLVLNDPTKRTTVRMDGKTYPLSADFTASLAYYPHPKLLGFDAMLHPGNYIKRAGIYLLQPYDPDRIPVLFIHGLTSSPQVWFNLINDVEKDPTLRGRFQFWVFGYPSGSPIAYSALQLRESLDGVYKTYPKTRNMMVVGHSLGGLLSQMQAINTGRVLFDGAFKDKADEVYAKLPADDVIKKALIFNANPHINEIVFVCTPHKGSYLATGFIGDIGVWLIKLPGNVIKDMLNGVGDSLNTIAGLNHTKIPDGIQGLSPKSPLLVSMSTLPVQHPYYSIIGTRGWPGPLPKSSDGVVPYWSSHLDGARAEMTVPYFHSCCEKPLTIAAVKLLLQKYLTNPPAHR
ncbi:MAG: alpha/beta hydrolase [Verrucomicrobiota bacterium]